MNEAELTALTQQTTGLAYIFVGAVGLWLYLMHVGDDGLRRWERLHDHFTVNRSAEPASGAPDDYVAPPRQPPSGSRVSPLVTDAETETEDDAEIYRPPPGAVETPYIRMTQQQLDQVKARAWLEGAGHAVGTLQGAGYLDTVISSERLTDAKRAVFGSSGRTLTAANKLIAQAATKAAPATEDARLVPVRGGKEGYIEL